LRFFHRVAHACLHRRPFSKRAGFGDRLQRQIYREKEIINRVAELYDQRNDIRKELERRIPRIQERVLTLFEEISGTGPKDGAAISKPAEASAVR
jgi:hypothetical protein